MRQPSQFFEIRPNVPKFPLLLAFIALGLSAAAVRAQTDDIFMYPAKGQSQAQQNQDRYECHSWAVQQTGFDPSRTAPQATAPPPAPAAYQPSQRHVVRGAGRGAAAGAVGGAIAGDAGKVQRLGRRLAAWQAGFVVAMREGNNTVSNNRLNNNTSSSTPPINRPSRVSAQHTNAQWRPVSRDADTLSIEIYRQ
jgi:hypothetical protein